MKNIILIITLICLYSCNNNKQQINRNIVIDKKECYGSYYEYRYYRTKYNDTITFYYNDSVFKNNDEIKF